MAVNLSIRLPAFHYTLWDRTGHFSIGGWWNGDRFDEFDASNPAPGTFGESYGFYLSSDQLVWKENRLQKFDALADGFVAVMQESALKIVIQR